MITNLQREMPKFLQNGGEMGKIINDKDWSSHPLGQPENWSLSLKFAISSMLKTAFPNFIFWGEDFRCFYNDAYRPSLGKDGKHPFIIGQAGKEAWPEIWDTIEPLLSQVWNTGKATWSENQLIPFYRNGKIENIYWTFSYSALMDDDEKIGGILTTCTETTDAVLNLQRLEEKEEQLRFAINAAELGTWDYNPKTNKFKANDRLKGWFGIDAKDNIELSMATDAIAPKDKNRVAFAIEEALKGVNGGKYDITYEIINAKSKKNYIVHVLGRAWFNSDNEAYRFNGTMQDVTAQVKVAEDLKNVNALVKKEEEHFRNIVQELPVGIAILRGSDNQFSIVNSTYLEIIDKSRAEIIDRPVYEVLPEIEETVVPVFEKVRKTGKPVSEIEFKVPLKRKNLVQDAYFNLTVQPITNDNSPVQDIMVVANEITDHIIARNILAENENQFRNLIMQSPIAMAIFRGKDFKIEMANDRMLNHFWHRNLNEVIGYKLIEVFPELADQKYMAELEAVVQTGTPVRDKESKVIVVTNKGKHEFYVDYEYLPLTEVDGTISGVIITVTDVTDRYFAKQKLTNFAKDLESQVKDRTEMLRSTNEKLKNSVKKLEEANTELESFAYISSHDLQEPLRKIQMFISRFEDQEGETLTDMGRTYFNKISDSAGRMRILIDDLLAFSRTEDDKSKLEPTDLNTILHQALENLSNQIELTGAKLITTELPTVNAIPFQMRQVFSNLIGNALKFSADEPQPIIEVTTEMRVGKTLGKMDLNDNTYYHKISIKDNGIGFTPGMEEKIFEVFQRLHGKKEYEGTGIGLAIVKKIMQNHEGAVKASSIEGEGATFTIYLPQMENKS
ncbi:PAS domain-containing protein [Pseudozobellia sp. WGM2]|uniref:PAS domain-containing protein n=1 Tax=Pseudozobellia sp. WGM2 TaxID=2787625 RepID=UPI001ADFF2EA|nr:PAS domain-containing protein [Pseudozobellia sp. WGM2]